ncbi:RHS repeat domain-containing protein, partial [Undibacterium sp. Ji83W]|uniref:RHS repeat domain-containing protein n=1 Tax=Undibacterium sp. Ji83W TaxID=3413043 RepID=UPI003BF3A685
AVTANTPKAYDIHADHLNTPRVITDATGTEVWRWDSAPFGETLPNEQPASQQTKFVFNQRFPGQYFDVETNLHYNYFRDYDPTIGRYVESDPIGLRGGMNTYTYTENNPIVRTDPKGLDWASDLISATTGSNFDPFEKSEPCPKDQCKYPITLAVGGGYCQPGDTSCVMAMTAAGLQGPYIIQYKTYSWPCLLAMGIGGKVGGVKGGNFIAGGVESAASAGAATATSTFGRVAAQSAGVVAKIWKSPLTTAAFLPTAIEHLFHTCECKK